MVKPSYSYDAPGNGTASTQAAEPAFGDPRQTTEIPTNAYIIDEPKNKIPAKGKLGDAATMVAGGAIALVGVPMLVLPGPGLLAIGGGVALMAKGAKGLFGNKK